MTGRATPGLLLALLLVLALWPFVEFVDDAPATADSVTWMLRGTPDSPDWVRWALWNSHFNVGFRPVMALSFAVTWLVAGLEHVWVYRLVDLALHGGAIAGVFAVGRRWWPDEPGRAAIAAAFFALHPLVQDIPSSLEYRGYSLSVLLLMAAVLATRPRGGLARGLLVGGLGAAAMLSNEVTVVALLLVPIALLDGDRPPGEVWIRHRAFLAAMVGVLVAAIVWRTAVVQGMGGYGMGSQVRVSRAGPIFATIVQRVLDGQYAFAAPTRWWTLLALGLCTGFVGKRALESWREGQLRPVFLLVAVLALVGFLSVQGVFFRRLYYPLVPVVALALVSLIRSGEPASWALAAALGAIPLTTSHAWWGADASKREARSLRDGWSDALCSRLDALDEPAAVFTVLPFVAPTAALNPFRAGQFPTQGVPVHERGALRWVERTHPEARLLELAWVEGDAVAIRVQRSAVWLLPGQRYYLPSDRRQGLHAGDETLLPTRGLAASYVFAGAADGGVWTPLGP